MTSKSLSLPRTQIAMAMTVLTMCFLLFSIDKDTHSVTDLFKPGNLVALILYFTPTYLITTLTYKLFRKKHDKPFSMLSALTIGISVGFAVVIVVMSFWMGRL